MGSAGSTVHSELSGAAGEYWPVIIVGAGPVGAALSIELAQRGVRNILVERNSKLHNIPKGQLLNGRTAEHFYFWNCLDQLRAKRVLARDKQLGTITVYNVLGSPYWYDKSIATPPQPGLYAEVGDRIEQYLAETVLRDRIAELPDAHLILGATVQAISQQADSVEVSVSPSAPRTRGTYSWESHGQDGAPDADSAVTLRGAYVVGCDGASSLVRGAVGAQLVGFDSGRQLTLTMFRSHELDAYLDELYPDGTTYRILRDGWDGFTLFIGRVDEHDTFFFHGPVPRDGSFEDKDALALIREVVGKPVEAEIDDVRLFHARVKIADRYRRSRVFIAGDAAHQHPSYGAYGLNNGLEDVANLGWKLAARLQGWGSEALLDSYDAERRKAFQSIGRLIVQGILNTRDFMDRYDVSRDREAFEAAWRKLAANGDEFKVQRESCYGRSPVVWGDAGSVTGSTITTDSEARAGCHLAPCKLSGGRSMFEALSREGLTLLALGADDDAVDRFETAAAALRVPMKILRDSFGGDRVRLGAHFVLVRPDQFVGWAGDDLMPSAAEIIGRVVGADVAAQTV